jgi:hypothetical protein
MPRPRARELFCLDKYWIAHDPGSEHLYRFWTNEGTGRTRRATLGTADLETAKERLADFVRNERQSPEELRRQRRRQWERNYRGENRHLNPTLQRVGKIYVLRFADWVKIGFAINVTKRLHFLRVAMPLEPTLLGTLDGSRLDELALHDKFKHLRARGEWFHMRDDIAEWIAATFPS